MRCKNLFAVLLAILMISGLAACGSGTSDTSAEVSSISTAEQQQAINDLAKDAQKVPEPATQAAVTSSSAVSSSNAQSVDKLLGEWADVNDSSRLVKITKEGDTYHYQDTDGTYTGSVSNGVLTIKISDAKDDTAKVFIDSATGNLVTNYQGDIYEFTRKTN